MYPSGFHQFKSFKRHSVGLHFFRDWKDWTGGGHASSEMQTAAAAVSADAMQIGNGREGTEQVGKILSQ